MNAPMFKLIIGLIIVTICTTLIDKILLFFPVDQTLWNLINSFLGSFGLRRNFGQKDDPNAGDPTGPGGVDRAAVGTTPGLEPTPWSMVSERNPVDLTRPLADAPAYPRRFRQVSLARGLQVQDALDMPRQDNIVYEEINRDDYEIYHRAHGLDLELLPLGETLGVRFKKTNRHIFWT